MFIAMNRFRIAAGREDDFEKVWRERDSQLGSVPGFRDFNLLRGPSTDLETLYASHTVWASRADFDAWRNSDAFRAAHGQSKAPEGTYLAHPDFEGFDVVL